MIYYFMKCMLYAYESYAFELSSIFMTRIENVFLSLHM